MTRGGGVTFWASENLSGRVHLEGYSPEWRLLSKLSVQPWSACWDKDCADWWIASHRQESQIFLGTFLECRIGFLWGGLYPHGSQSFYVQQLTLMEVSSCKAYISWITQITCKRINNALLFNIFLTCFYEMFYHNFLSLNFECMLKKKFSGKHIDAISLPLKHKKK